MVDPPTLGPRRRTGSYKKIGAEARADSPFMTQQSVTIVPPLVSPVAVLTAPAAVVLDPAVGYPMPVSVCTHLVPAYPHVATTAPVPVAGRPFPARTHHGHCFVARSRRRDPDVDIGGSRGGDDRAHGAGSQAQRYQHVSLVHECIPCGFRRCSFARSMCRADRTDADARVGQGDARRRLPVCRRAALHESSALPDDAGLSLPTKARMRRIAAFKNRCTRRCR